MEVCRIKLILIITFLAFCSHAQVTKTEEVKTNYDRDIAHLRELFQLQMDAVAKAKDVQDEENKRRLSELNNHAAMVALMVTRIEFDKLEERIVADAKSQDEKIVDLESWKAKMIGQFAILQIAFFIIIALLNHFKPFAKKETKPTT